MHQKQNALAKSLLACSWGALLGAPWFSAGCDEFTYDSPPRPEIVGIVDNVLTDFEGPIVVTFSEPVDAATLKVKLVLLDLDDEGNLADEDDDDATVLTEFFSFDGATGTSTLGTGTLSEDRRTLTIDAATSLPVGPSLAVLIEPGLSDDEGNAWEVRQRLVFGYSLACAEGAGAPTTFPSGYYFFVADIETPLPIQLQLFAYLDVDPATGGFVGQFTNADRNRDGSRCSPACGAEDACQTIPTEQCVAPSTPAGSEDEFSDYLPNFTPPTGFSFGGIGCIVETEGGSVFINAPTDVNVLQPAVYVEGIKLSLQFAQDGETFRGTGVSGANQVFLGGPGASPAGAAKGTVTGRLIPPGEEPPDIPRPE
jgi:hypothetical protein